MDGLGLSKGALRIGLTGGIGSGKSTAATQLAAMGARVVDTDAIARALTGPDGQALAAIAEAFGAHYINADGLDRAAMRRLVFDDGSARHRLEGLLHPLIREQAEAQAQAAPHAELLVFDVPLLVESASWRQQVDRVLLIDCEVAVQRERVLRRPGWQAEQLEGVLRAQTDRARRRSAADAIIDNSRLSLSELERELKALIRHWRHQAVQTEGDASAL